MTNMVKIRDPLIQLTLWALNFLVMNSLCSAEAPIQNVLWSSQHEELEESYFGKCTCVQGSCGFGNSNPKEGICVKKGTCEKWGGTPNGNCQDGSGDCCSSMHQCEPGGAEVDVNELVNTLISPINTKSQCSFRFKKEPSICQIKLDFISVQMASAGPNGICDNDKLIISNSITVPNNFTTCGELNGQHMYLTFGSQATIEITPILTAISSTYTIVATSIPCDSNRRVPNYCLQHFESSTGMVKSFDFGSQQQNSQQYTICVKPMPQSIGVKWMPCAMTPNPFDIATNFGAEPLKCMKDWIQPKGGDKICETFTDTTSSWKPYDLLVNFDEWEFPPLPFNMPITGPCDEATNCPAGDFGYPFMCGCVENICQCSLHLSAAPGALMPDFNNTGFCLEYNQL